ncbi:MAG: hypothetical protein HKN94_03285, partial [Acidimicrobiales bacterium]|nr:hypothetical protein [Acidimicrobiales bacterium]
MTHVLAGPSDWSVMLKLFPDRVITLRGAAILTVALLVGCGDDPPPEGLAALDPLVPTTTTVVQSAEEIELIERAGR